MSMNKTRDSGLGGIPFAQRPVTGHGTAIAAALRSYKDFQQNSVAANKVRDLPHAPTGSVEPWTAPLTPSVKATNERIVSLCLATCSFPLSSAQIDAQSTTPQACYVASKKEVELSEVLKKAANRAIGGGVAGAAAMAINVSTLM